MGADEWDEEASISQKQESEMEYGVLKLMKIDEISPIYKVKARLLNLVASGNTDSPEASVKQL